MLIANPFTGQVLNANPEGCNQYTGSHCTGSEKELFRAGSPDIILGSYGTESAASRFHHPDRPIRRYAVATKKSASLYDEGEDFRRSPKVLIKALIKATHGEKNQGLPRGFFGWHQELNNQGIYSLDDNRAYEAIRKVLERAGYDSIEYDNWVEDRGSKSVIPLRPTQVRELPFPHVG